MFVTQISREIWVTVKEEIMQILKGRFVLTACLVLQGQLTAAVDSPAAIDQLNPITAAAQRVSLRDGLLSIHARQAAWAQVLHEITKQSGIRFHYAIPLEGSVTASFTDLPWFVPRNFLKKVKLRLLSRIIES